MFKGQLICILKLKATVFEEVGRNLEVSIVETTGDVDELHGKEAIFIGNHMLRDGRQMVVSVASTLNMSVRTLSPCEKVPGAV